MNLPFFQKTGVGVHVAEAAVYWVEVTHLGSRTWLRRHDFEPIAEDGASAALRRLAERATPPAGGVSVFLDPAHVRSFVLDAPAFDQNEDLDGWLTSETARLLPRGVSAGRLVTRYCLLHTGEEHQRVLAACTREETIDERRRLFEDTGLKVRGIGCLFADLGHAFAFDPSFAEGAVAVLYIDDATCTLLYYRDGALLDALEIFPGDGSTALKEAGNHLEATRLSASGPARPTTLLVVDMTAPDPDDVAPPSPTIEASLAVRWARPLAGLLADGIELPAVFAPAAALAISRLYPALPSIHFLPDAAVRDLEAAEDRVDAVRGVLTVYGALLLLLLSVTMLDTYLTALVGREQVAYQHESEKSAVVERARADLLRAKSHQEKSLALAVSRTRSAGVLEAVGRAVPQDTWLTELNLESEADASMVLTVKGVAVREKGTMALMHRLEQMSPFANVRLITLEAASPPTSNPHPVAAFRFEVRLDASTL